jgi:hypothetical protein
MPTESGGTAYFYRRHHASLGEIDVTGVRSAPGVTVAMEDVR